MLVANEGLVCEQMPEPIPAVSYEPGQWMMVFLPPHANQIRLMKHDRPRGTCGGSGVEIGWYTPLLFAGLPVVALILLVWWPILLFRRPPLEPAREANGR
jgi:hypothetical protein